MNLRFAKELADTYTSLSQKARVLSEAWFLAEVYCPSCGEGVQGYANNKPVADFYCPKCAEDFELKAKNGKIGKTVSAGAYSQMIKRITSSEKPNFFFMGYEAERWDVQDLFVVPKHFFVADIIEQRTPLAASARRAGWVGSNILFSKIPKAGQIFYVKEGREVEKTQVLEQWQKTVFLKQITKSEAKGWILDIMNCIDALNKKEFRLQDVYAFERELALLHPENTHIQPKIRQQLQVLRDKGYLEFMGEGTYRVK